MENEALVVDLVAWVAERPRPYAEVMEAWRTSCPRLAIWEDAVAAGLVRQKRDADGPAQVVATAAGAALLRAHGRAILTYQE